MKVNLDILQQINPKSLWLTFSETEIKQARSILGQYSNQTAKNQALINYLVQICLSNWLKDNLDCSLQTTPKNHQYLWEFINGFTWQIRIRTGIFFNQSYTIHFSRTSINCPKY